MPTIVHDEKVKVSQEQLERNEWIKNHLSRTSKEFIMSLSKEIIITGAGMKIYIAHYPMDRKMNFKKHIKFARLQENEEMFKDKDADIYLYGHTHSESYNHNSKKYYINPGALGCPGKTDEAPYGILEINENEVTYKQMRVHYNVQKVINEIEQISFPGYKHVLKIFYGDRSRK